MAHIHRGTAIKLSELLASGLNDVGEGLAAIAQSLESGEASPSDAAIYLRAIAEELRDIARTV